MSEPAISTDPANKGNANLIYILYLVGLAAGITTIVGVVMAYMAKEEAPDWLRSHYVNQINIFWKALAYMILGAILTIVLIGFLIILAATVWYIIRVVKGMQLINEQKPVPDPSTWGL